MFNIPRQRKGQARAFGFLMLLYGLLGLWGVGAPAWALADKDILRHADRARGNLEGVIWPVFIDAQEDRNRDERHLEVQARGYDFLAVMTDPPKVRGHKLLMVNHNMWFAKPGLSKPVPVSPRQKLVGGASYGDIAATNYAEDYEVLEVSQGTIHDEPCYVFDLKAAHKNVTYDRIKYWISRERLVGVRAEYYTLSEKKFKEAEFEYNHKIEQPGGSTQPFISSMRIVETLASNNVTILHFGVPRLEPIPASVFNVNTLMSR